jgi:hypothetical protein
VPTVTTIHTSLIDKSQYPPVFDGSKTIRPSSRKLYVAPPPVTSETKQTKPAVNNLEFTPPPKASVSLRQLLAEAGQIDDMDSMHVTTFEKLMRSTNHNLLAIQPETLKMPSERCKKFLSVDCEKGTAISRADFSKSREADEVLCSLQGLFDFLNKLIVGVEGTLTVQTMRRKLKPRYQTC